MIQEFIGTGYVLNSVHTKILLIHHKKFNKWLPPGGHCNANEAPHEAARREVMEETGVTAQFIEPKDSKIQSLSSLEEQVPTPYCVLKEFIEGKFGKREDHYHIDFIYLMEAPEGILTRNEKETLDLGWFGKDQIKDLPTFTGFQSIAEKILNK